MFHSLVLGRLAPPATDPANLADPKQDYLTLVCVISQEHAVVCYWSPMFEFNISQCVFPACCFCLVLRLHYANKYTKELLNRVKKMITVT